MGLLRLLLAITVVFGHVYIALFVGPTAAVQTFYIISGFYIALVLDTTPAYRSATRFYENRYLRLFPLYIVTAVAALCLTLLSRPAEVGNFTGLPLPTKMLLGLTNLTLAFQDWVMFLGLHHGHLHFVKSFNDSSPYPLYHFLAVPQAWSLGVELSFYLLAPVLMRLKTRWLVGVVALSGLCRAIGYHFGLREDPWSYRFFPFEVGVFCLGALAYRIYARVRERSWFQLSGLRYGLLAVFFLFTLTFVVVPLPGRRPLYLAMACVCVPVLFDITKKSRFDRFIGELSYPVYITHNLVLATWLALPWCRDLAQTGLRLALIVTALSISLSLAMNRWIQAPVERWRKRNKRPIASLTTP